MKKWVVDASVACKWHFVEIGADIAMKLLRRGEILLAPESFMSEFANLASRKHRTGDATRKQAEDAMAEVADQISPFVPVRDLLPVAFEMSVALEHPIYDCIYLALALRTGAVFITDDRVFARKVANSQWRDLVVLLDDYAANAS